MAEVKPDKNKALEELFTASPFFEGLSPEHRQVLVQNSRLLHHGPGEIIVRRTEAARGFYMVASGRVKVYRTSPEGREQTLYHFAPGEPFCLCALFEGREFLADASALEESDILFIPYENLERMGREIPAILFNLLFLLARRLKDAMDMVESLSTRTLGERLALYVSRLHAEAPDSQTPARITLPMTHRELAKIVGASKEALSRTFKSLAEKGFLLVDGREIQVLDPAGLAKLAGL